jgi:hypothetical protein
LCTALAEVRSKTQADSHDRVKSVSEKMSAFKLQKNKLEQIRFDARDAIASYELARPEADFRPRQSFLFL